MIHQLVIQQGRHPQVIVMAKSYHLRKTRNPAGLAVLIEKDGLAELWLLCPGCGDPIQDGQSTGCSCYKEV